jgi:hypothetical protein
MEYLRAALIFIGVGVGFGKVVEVFGEGVGVG